MENKNFRGLTVYKKAFKLVMDVFRETKNYPDQEKYGLISQIRRSSSSVCSTIAEGCRKRQYEGHFVSKATDADMENSETQVWLDFSLACEYISKEKYNNYMNKTEEIVGMLNHMIETPKKYLRQSEKSLNYLCLLPIAYCLL